MRTVPKLTIDSIAHHRNGICGEPFWVILFRFTEDGITHRMVATYFDVDNTKLTPKCAVLDVDMTALGNIGFAEGNSWRGDHFSDALREAIRHHENR